MPRGLDSYPACETRGSLIRSAVEGFDPDILLPELPSALTEYITSPSSVRLWAPAVHFTALFYAVCDLYHPTLPEMEAAVRKRSQYLSSGVYRGLMRMTGPRVLFHVTSSLQRFFQRGVTLDVDTSGEDMIQLQLKFPAHLRTYMALAGNVPIYEVLAETAGMNDVEGTLTKWDATSAHYVVRWSKP